MTDITELTQESSRESGSILIIVAARMARREFFTPLHALCESGKRVVSTRALCDAVERAEEHMVRQVSKIVDGHDRLTKKLKEAESRNDELVEALEKAQQRIDEVQQGFIANQEEAHEAIKYATELKEQLARACAGREEAFREVDEMQKSLDHTHRRRTIWRGRAVTAEAEIAALRNRIAELESRTVKLPELCVGVVQGGHAVMVPYAAGHWFNKTAILEMLAAAGIKVETDSVDSDLSHRNQPGMVIAVHIDVGDFVKVKDQVFEVEETDFDDHDVTLWFVGGETLKCAAGCQIEVVSAPEEEK